MHEDNFEEYDKNPKKLPEMEFPIDTRNVDLNDLMAKIRNYVLANRIRIKEFFQDMDPLNSGLLTKSQFIRCLSSFDVSLIGSFNLNKVQTEALCNQYTSTTDKKKINWKKFEEDIESGFYLFKKL